MDFVTKGNTRDGTFVYFIIKDCQSGNIESFLSKTSRLSFIISHWLHIHYFVFESTAVVHLGYKTDCILKRSIN